MSKSGRNLDFLLDIQEAIDRALEYTSGMTWEGYLNDRRTQDAVVRNLEILGEATKNISEDFRGQNLAIPWRYMTGTRDRLIHHYFGVNQEIVWEIVQQDLPVLKEQIAELIDKLRAGDV